MKNFLGKITAIFIMIAIILINVFAFAKPVMASEGATLVWSIDTNGIVTVNGESPNEEFSCLMIDDGKTQTYYSDISGEKSFKKTFDATEFEIGYHSLSAKLSGGEVIYAETPFPTLIYDKVTIKKNSNFLTVGSNYVVFTPDFAVDDDNGMLCVQIGKKNVWGAKYGPFKSFTGQKITKYLSNEKLKPDTEYQIRAFYYKDTEYNGKSQPFFSPVSNTITFKTGKAKAPEIKSISAKCVSQKKRTFSSGGRWDAGGVWHPATSTTIWETKYKVTVKLKKKPGTKGIYIGGTKVKGNKTTYTVTVTNTGKLKGKKVKIGVSSYNDDKVGSYSPEVVKKVKIK